MTGSQRTVIHSARLVSDGRITADGWVAFDGDTITDSGSGRPPGGVASAGATVVDARGGWLTPGFIDIHCHGGGGVAFDDGADAIRTALTLHRAHGTTRSVLSLVTAPIRQLELNLAVMADLVRADPLLLGAHLEGPFIAHGHRGAHDPALLRTPDASSIDRLLEAGGGALRQVTLAPELAGGMDAVRRFVDADVIVAVGHTDADFVQAAAAFDAGASILTHAFNGMPPLHHREPGPVAAAVHASGVTLEVINDGTHLHPNVVSMVFAAAPTRIALITDAMAAAGSADGEYSLGSLSVTVVGGIARLTDGDSIAGSTLTLDAALKQAVTVVGLPVEVAVQALTETPARAIGREHDLGKLEAGFAADAVLLNDEFTVSGVWAAGRRLR